MIPKTRRDLDPLKCGAPGCNCAGPLILTSRCHPGRPVLAIYDWTTGVLTLRCHKCNRDITGIAVATEHPGGE